MRLNQLVILMIFLVFSYGNTSYGMDQNPYNMDEDNLFNDPQYYDDNSCFLMDEELNYFATNQSIAEDPEQARKRVLDQFYNEIQQSPIPSPQQTKHYNSYENEYRTQTVCHSSNNFANQNSPRPLMHRELSPATYTQPQNIPQINYPWQEHSQADSTQYSYAHSAPNTPHHHRSTLRPQPTFNPPSPESIPRHIFHYPVQNTTPPYPHSFSLSPRHTFLEIVNEEESLQQFNQQRFSAQTPYTQTSPSSYSTSPALNHSPRTPTRTSAPSSPRSLEQKIPLITYVFGYPHDSELREKKPPYFFHYPTIRKNTTVNPDFFAQYEQTFIQVLKRNKEIAVKDGFQEHIIAAHTTEANIYLYSKKVTYLIDKGRSLVDRSEETPVQKTRSLSAPTAHGYMTRSQSNRSQFVPNNSQPYSRSTNSTPRLPRR